MPCEHFVKRTDKEFVFEKICEGTLYCSGGGGSGGGYNVFNKVLKINQVFAGGAKSDK